MDVILFAWCPTSVLYLEALAAASCPPALVVTGTRTAPSAPLPAACERLGVPLERRDDVNDPAFVARLRALGADLILVAGCTRILGPGVRAAPRIGALNFHPSRLPDYRGKEPLFWALLRGETSVALTVHHVTEDVDAGPILFQRPVPVPPRATSASLAPIVDREGAALVPQILALAAAGALPEGAHPAGPGSHVPPLRAEHGLVDFTRSAIEVDRLVRAARGEIAAYTFFHGMRLVVIEGEPAAEATAGATPGQILRVEGDALVVAAAGGAYRARRFVFLDRVHDGPAIAAALGIEAGARLSANPAF